MTVAPTTPLASLLDTSFFKTVVESTLSTCFVLFIVVATFLRGKMLEWIYQKVQTHVKLGSILHPETAAGHARVNERLTAVLNATQAMRVCLFQFHNGDTFMLSNHSWKLTCTHEVLRPGIGATQKANTSHLVSSVSDVVAPMLDPLVKVAGAEQRPACVGMTASCPHACKGARRVMRYLTSELPCTLAKILAEEQKVKVFYTINLLEPRTNAVFGFIGIQFDEIPEDFTEIEDKLCAACVAAEAVEFFLTSEFGGCVRKSKTVKSIWPWRRKP